MNQTTANLLRYVLPPQPLRQWVLTLSPDAAADAPQGRRLSNRGRV